MADQSRIEWTRATWNPVACLVGLVREDLSEPSASLLRIGRPVSDLAAKRVRDAVDEHTMGSS